MRIPALALSLATLLASAPVATAQPILAFDNTTAGLNLASGGALTAPSAFPQNNLYATRFVSSVSGTLAGFDFLLGTFNAPASLNIYFAPDSAGLPATGAGANTLLGSLTFSTAFGSGVFSSVNSLGANPAVTAGTPGWIVLVPTTSQFSFWQHATATGTALSAFSMGTNPDLASYTPEASPTGALRVFVNPAAVPEPGTVAAGVGALGAVGGMLLRRRKKA